MNGFKALNVTSSDGKKTLINLNNVTHVTEIGGGASKVHFVSNGFIEIEYSIEKIRKLFLNEEKL